MQKKLCGDSNARLTLVAAGLISNLASIFIGSIRRKAHEQIQRKWSVGVSRDCPIFFGYPLCYLRNGKSYGFQIRSVYSEGPSGQKSIKKVEKSVRGRIQGLPNFFRYPLLSQEWVKLLNSILHPHLQAQSEQSPLKISGKVAVGVVRDSRNIIVK